MKSRQQSHSEPPDDETRKIVRSELQSYFGKTATTRRDRDQNKAGEKSDHQAFMVDLEDWLVSHVTPSGIAARSFGPYRIEKQLGRGGMGAVYLASREGITDKVALKVSDRHSGKPDLRDEAKMLGLVNHPNVVGVIDSGATSEHTWMAMELLTGRNLADYLLGDGDLSSGFISFEDSDSSQTGAVGRSDHQLLPVADVIQVFRDLLSALDTLHVVGLIHRDIKPANIMISDEGKAFLVDFGLVIEEDGESVTGVLEGTIPYMSPEQTLNGFVDLTPASDLYSLSVTFLECLTGSRVVDRSGSDHILEKIAFGPMRPPSKVSSRLSNRLDPIFAKALAKHPQARYKSGREFDEDLACYLADQRLVHAREPRTAGLRRFARQKPWVTTFIILVVLAALVSTVLPPILKSKALDELIATSDRYEKSGDLDSALAVLDDRAERFSGDERFDERYLRFISQLAPSRTEQLFRDTNFSISGRPDPPRVKRIIDQAEFHFSRLASSNADLLCQICWGHLRDERHDLVLDRLEQHHEVVAKDRRLLELLAWCHIERGDGDAVRRVDDRIRRLEGQASVAALCLRANRIVKIAALPEEDQLGLTIEIQELRRIECALKAVLATEPRHQLARCVLGLLLFEMGYYEEALGEFTALHKASDEADRDAILIWKAAAATLVAVTSTSVEESKERWQVALDDAAFAIKEDEGLLAFLAATIGEKASWKGSLDWCRLVLQSPDRAFAALPSQFWETANYACYEGCGEHAFSAVAAFAALAEARLPTECNTASLKEWHQVQTIGGLGILSLAQHSHEEKKADETLAHVDRLLNLVERERQRVEHVSFDLAYSEMEALFLAAKATEPDKRNVWQERASKALKGFLHPETLERALLGASRDEERESIKAMHQRIAKLRSSQAQN